MLKIAFHAALAFLLLAGTCFAADPGAGSPNAPRPQLVVAAPVILPAVGPQPTDRTLVESLLPAGLPAVLPSELTADQDAGVDAAMLLPAIQAAREAPRR